MAAFAALEAVERLRVPCEGCGVEGGGERTISIERGEGSREDEMGREGVRDSLSPQTPYCQPGPHAGHEARRQTHSASNSHEAAISTRGFDGTFRHRRALEIDFWFRDSDLAPSQRPVTCRADRSAVQRPEPVPRT